MNCSKLTCKKNWWGTRCVLPLVVALIALAAPLGPPINDSSIFELDGNADDPSTPTGLDWKTLNPPGSPPAGAASSYVQDAVNSSADRIFSTGGSKDTNEVTQWRHTAQTAPDKNDLENCYSYAKIESGELRIYFGCDRYSTEGDSDIGFWFFQSEVAPITSGPDSGKFSGATTVGDLLVLSKFTTGGSVPGIEVKRVQAIDSKGNVTLQTLFPNGGSTVADCTAAGVNAYACASVNSGNINVDWTYVAKFPTGASENVPPGGFFEGGINLTAILNDFASGTQTPCISSFLARTTTAAGGGQQDQYKDFASGSFDVCGLGVTKVCGGDGTLNAGGLSIHYLFNGTVTNTGVGALSNVTIVDSLPAGAANPVFKKGTPAVPPAIPGAATTAVSTSACPSGAPAGAVCANIGSLGAAAAVNWSVEFDLASTNAQNNAYAAAATGGGSPGACNASGTFCAQITTVPQCSASPTNRITVTKGCGVPEDHLGIDNPATDLPGTQLVTQSSLAAVQVNFSGAICNTGDTPLTGVTLTDNPGAILTIAWPGTPGGIAAGACVPYSGSYLPSGVTPGDLGGAAGRYSFSDEIKVTGATATLGASPGHDPTCTSTFASDAQACNAATCNICPASAICAGP